MLSFRLWLVLVLALLLASPLHAQEQKKGGSGGKGPKGRTSPVVVVTARMEMLAPTTWVSGAVISRNDARLATEVEGRLKQVAEVGTRVKAGDVLARIDNTLVKLQIEELEAAVEREKARLEFLSAELKRLNQLKTKNNASQTLLERTRSERDVASNELRIERSRLSRAKEELRRHVVRAPFSGVVAERFRQPGERAAEGNDVVRLIDSDHLEVQANVPLTSINYVNENSELKIYAGPETGDDQTSGKVRTIVPVGGGKSRLMDLRISLEGSRWRVGQAVRVGLPSALPKEVLAVPRDALVLRREGAIVFKVDDNNTAVKVPVIVGVASGDLIEVSGELAAGERVVIRGGERLRPGAQVEVLPGL